MDNNIKTDICIIGGGAGGLNVAAAASQMGANVVLIEKSKMGGDCLNYGCVPSKTLLTTARAAKTIRESEKYGLAAEKLQVDYHQIRNRIRAVIAKIAEHDSIQRFEKMGVKVIQGTASFIDKTTVIANNTKIQAHYFVIATGSSPIAPPIPGLETVNYLTNETIFDLEKQPEHLLIIGGGTIGCELAQAHCLLGTKVSLFQRSTILAKEDPDLVDIIRKQLIADGISLHEKLEFKSIEQNEHGIQINIIDTNKNVKQYSGSHLLVATGRKPNLDELNLDAADIEYTKHGITVDNTLRSTNKHAYAIGDVAGGLQFTHIASYHASIVIPNILFHWPTKAHYDTIPRVTFTEPELAAVGLTEKEAREKYKNIRVLTQPFKDNDRAQTEFDTTGLIKVITKKSGEIIGASIVGHQTDNLINVWTLMINEKRKIKNVASLIFPYPTRGEINKRVAGVFYTTILFSNKIKSIVQFLLKWWK